MYSFDMTDPKMPYDGPYRVISRNKKTFVIDIKKKKVRVTIDRLKPAYIIVDDHSKEDISREIQTSTPNLQSRIKGHVPEEEFVFQTVLK
jgi:hypothetical protein